MNKEELELYVKKSCENILKQLAENPNGISNRRSKYRKLTL